MNEQHSAGSTETKLTPEEAAIVDVVRFNRLNPRKSYVWTGRLGRWAIKYERRSKDNAWGRFGGGWNWKLGIDIGGSTVILNLLVSNVRISRVKS